MKVLDDIMDVEEECVKRVLIVSDKI